MDWIEASTENCPVGAALALLGEKWTLLIVRDALNGVHRFDDFRQHIGLSEAVLADRLRKLVDGGVLETRAYREPGSRERQEYRLTAKGRELLPVVLALKQWGETYHGDPKGSVIDVRHRGCGGDVRVLLQCSDHRDPLSVYDTVATAGPGARRARPLRSKRS